MKNSMDMITKDLWKQKNSIESWKKMKMKIHTGANFLPECSEANSQLDNMEFS